MKCKHEFRQEKISSVGYYGILVICIKCGKPFTYDANWDFVSLT